MSALLVEETRGQNISAVTSSDSLLQPPALSSTSISASQAHEHEEPQLSPESKSKKKGVTFASCIAEVVGYQYPNESPLLKLWEEDLPQAQDLTKFLHLSLTYLLGKPPGIFKYNQETHGPLWAKLVHAHSTGELDGDIHDLIVELSPWLEPPRLAPSQVFDQQAPEKELTMANEMKSSRCSATEDNNDLSEEDSGDSDYDGGSNDAAAASVTNRWTLAHIIDLLPEPEEEQEAFAAAGTAVTSQVDALSK